jgi:transcriptional regulator with PAS, ATPase and Fis domain
MAEKDLEETIKEKISPLVEETMEKSWGVTIPKLGSDLTDKLKNPQLDIYVPLGLNFQDAKKIFKKEFLKRELRIHLGNISQLAKSLGINRRSVHRAIKDLEIDVGELRIEEKSLEKYRESIIDKTIRSTLHQYKELIQPQKMEQMYQEVPRLSRNIAKFLPHQDVTWKEAEREFEKQFIKHALKESKQNVSKTAKKINIRPETLHRKIKKLSL